MEALYFHLQYILIAMNRFSDFKHTNEKTLRQIKTQNENVGNRRFILNRFIKISNRYDNKTQGVKNTE